MYSTVSRGSCGGSDRQVGITAFFLMNWLLHNRVTAASGRSAATTGTDDTGRA